MGGEPNFLIRKVQLAMLATSVLRAGKVVGTGAAAGAGAGASAGMLTEAVHKH